MSQKMTFTSGRILFTLIAVFNAVSPFLADWNETHIYNPAWPPHAKFHNAQTMAMAVLLALATLYFVWSSRDSQRIVLPAAVTGGLYWLSQALGFLFPGVAEQASSPLTRKSWRGCSPSCSSRSFSTSWSWRRSAR
jgi:small-conductance mechanosensitive channel